ncbi:unnamed protein product [Adineta ricciae]|uniref:Uncharacterized protein n=1 Tax=Adineta ricciae TaxID=249248 RepID=A0A815F2V8_ADIRI|nr:unnamed protein product [Adineta ricciae]CAF1319481.1 unnamed protein product [Adineta ricciae]
MSTVDYSQTPFQYDPSIAAASIFLLVFLLVTICHIYQLIRYKTWYLIPIVICGVAEIIGYSTRLASRQDSYNINLYSAQYAFLVLAPIFLAASVYIILGQIIRFVDHPSLIPAKWIAIIFVICDIISFIIQVIGAIILLNQSKSSNLTTGKYILLAGLIVQVVTFLFFIICAVHFHIDTIQNGKNGKWKWLMMSLYIDCALILVSQHMEEHWILKIEQDICRRTNGQFIYSMLYSSRFQCLSSTFFIPEDFWGNKKFLQR